jgi:hypothetical protein
MTRAFAASGGFPNAFSAEREISGPVIDDQQHHGSGPGLARSSGVMVATTAGALHRDDPSTLIPLPRDGGWLGGARLVADTAEL